MKRTHIRAYGMKTSHTSALKRGHARGSLDAEVLIDHHLIRITAGSGHTVVSCLARSPAPCLHMKACKASCEHVR
jgi:hypothetical protein